LCEALGADLTRAYLALRRDELARWDAQGHAWSLDEVTPWELREYLPFY
jgi:glutamine synthetase